MTHLNPRIALLIVCFLLNGCSLGHDKFDSEKWKVADASARAPMVNDLIERKLVIGKTKDEVVELLGLPDKSEPKWYKYYVRERFLLFDRVFMWVSFDEVDGKVVFVSVADD